MTYFADCPCGAKPKIEYNTRFRCRVCCPSCGRHTGWHDRPIPAELEWEKLYGR